MIDEKAIFQGSCNMNQDASKRPKPNNKALKAMKKEALTDINNALKGTDSSSGESTGTEG